MLLEYSDECAGRILRKRKAVNNLLVLIQADMTVEGDVPVKGITDYVTADIDDDGIEKALRYWRIL